MKKTEKDYFAQEIMFVKEQVFKIMNLNHS